MLYDKEKQKGNANRATLAVARKLVAYLMAVGRGQRTFRLAETSNCIAAQSVAVEQGGFLRRVACQVLPLSRLGEGAQRLEEGGTLRRQLSETTSTRADINP